MHISRFRRNFALENRSLTKPSQREGCLIGFLLYAAEIDIIIITYLNSQVSLQKNTIRHPSFGEGLVLFTMSVEQLKTVQQALDMKVLMNHIYEYKKGVRQMILFTCNARYEDFAVNRLKSQGIEYIIQRVGNSNINIFFGKKQCLDAIRIIVDKPLVRLSPEHDFIIGALLGYDICCQCERFCERKQREQKEYA